MKATVEKIEKNKVKLEIEVDPHIFDKAMESAYLKNRKNIAIPGFRKGKAPRKVIERYYGERIFYEDALNIACPEAYDQAVKENGIEPVDRPEIDIVQIGQGNPLIFTATVTIKPEVELGQYKGVEVEKVEYPVTDEEVEERLRQELERNARWITVEDRAVKLGDRVTLDYSGTVDGEAFEGGTAQNQSLEIGSGRFIPGFEEQLIGANIGEEKEIKVTFPEDYFREELKGKEAVFKVTVHEIKEKELPALDDEFAKDVSEFDTLEEYKADLRKKMEEIAKERAQVENENNVISKVVENATVDIPEVMVENQLDSILRDFDYRLRFQGLDLERYLKLTNTSLDDFRAQYRNEAYNRVKTQLVLEKIAREEAITVEEADMEKEYERMAEQYKRSVDEVKKDFAGSAEYIKENLLIQKTVDFLVHSAHFTEKKESAEADSESEK